MPNEKSKFAEVQKKAKQRRAETDIKSAERKAAALKQIAAEDAAREKNR